MWRKVADPQHQQGSRISTFARSATRSSRWLKLIDTEGRVDRFTKKFGAQTVEKKKVAAKAVKDAKAKKAPAKKKAS